MVVGLARSVFDGRQNILAFKERIVRQNFLVRRARAQQIKNIRDAHPHAANARTPAAFSRLDGDALEQFSVHAGNLILFGATAISFTRTPNAKLRSQAFAVGLVVAVPAAQGGIAGVGEKKWQRRRFNLASQNTTLALPAAE
jgi:hypothetical protein